ncbi:MAG TPA: alpha/beta hydrolase-fold protein [Chitinophagaceae bacterium]|nr:alpha/beta hydrolase-fold protein [Chitinophagaceae bacterium]
MQVENVSGILVEKTSLLSIFLDREVKVDFYLPRNVTDPSQMSLLLINDGQDMEKMGFEAILENAYNGEDAISPLLCAAIHCSAERKMEYGVAGIPDYKGRGAKAGLYTSFILEELLPFIRGRYAITSFREKAFAGFSLGGLMALDIVWKHPEEFTKAGVFSGSLWWRNIDQSAKEYDDNSHRIMHQQVAAGNYAPWLRFFFQCGNMDEIKDRNKNGIIDSIDDTLDLIKELESKGYRNGKDIRYLELPDGQHDVPTWGRAMPYFLQWGWLAKAAFAQ